MEKGWQLDVERLKELGPRTILFLCVNNSARSQIAEGIARALAPQGVEIFSAGSDPKSVNPLAIKVLREIGIDISHHRSKGVHEIPASKVDAVITLCAEEVCPVWLGSANRFHWGLPDPAAGGGDEQSFRLVRDELVTRLERLFGRSLPKSQQ